MAKYIGILTAGGDSPGLNAAIRGVGKAALGSYGMQFIGFRDGFRGFMENRTMELDNSTLSGILTLGGTILGTSRDKPHRMPVGGKLLDMTDVMADNYHKHNLDVLVCLGGAGTQKNAYRLAQKGLNIILALGAGIAGGADVILIPEIPYDVESIADAIRRRSHSGKRFSGYVQRGGTPSAADRLLATRLGTACADLIHKGQYGVMVAARKEDTKPVPLEDVAGKLKSVPLDHPWVAAARRVGTCMGD